MRTWVELEILARNGKPTTSENLTNLRIGQMNFWFTCGNLVAFDSDETGRIVCNPDEVIIHSESVAFLDSNQNRQLDKVDFQEQLKLMLTAHNLAVKGSGVLR